MGLSNLPAPSDSMLTLVLINTALYISLLKEILRSAIHAIGLSRYCISEPDSNIHHRLAALAIGGPIYHLPTDCDYASSSTTSGPGSFADRFLNRVKPVRFGNIRTPDDCRVCLTRFELESEVNLLPSCGHMFHTSCLQKWLDYHHITCPLCRTPILPPAVGDGSYDDGDGDGDDGSVQFSAVVLES